MKRSTVCCADFATLKTVEGAGAPKKWAPTQERGNEGRYNFLWGNLSEVDSPLSNMGHCKKLSGPSPELK